MGFEDEIFKRGKGLKYTSAETRSTSLDFFCGGAQGDETFEPVRAMPGAVPEDLEKKFKSSVCRIDLPLSHGYPDIIRKLADKSLGTAEAIRSWRRHNGEPLWKK